MKYRKFGKLDWQVSFGIWRYAAAPDDNNPSQVDESESIKMIRYAIDNGVNIRHRLLLSRRQKWSYRR